MGEREGVGGAENDNNNSEELTFKGLHRKAECIVINAGITMT